MRNLPDMAYSSASRTPPAAQITTTTHGGVFHTVNRMKPARASVKSFDVKMALVHTGS